MIDCGLCLCLAKKMANLRHVLPDFSLVHTVRPHFPAPQSPTVSRSCPLARDAVSGTQNGHSHTPTLCIFQPCRSTVPRAHSVDNATQQFNIFFKHVCGRTSHGALGGIAGVCLFASPAVHVLFGCASDHWEVLVVRSTGGLKLAHRVQTRGLSFVVLFLRGGFGPLAARTGPPPHGIAWCGGYVLLMGGACAVIHP